MGEHTHYDYGFRIYNPQIAKFLSVDPLTASYPWYTPYQFAGNMPIVAIDLDGLEPKIYNKNWKFKEKIYTADELNQMLQERYQEITKFLYKDNDGIHVFNKQGAHDTAKLLNGIDPSTKDSDIPSATKERIKFQYREFKLAADEILEQYDRFFFNSQLHNKRLQEAQERAEAIALRNAEHRLRQYHEQVKEGKVSAYFDIGIGSIGFMVSGFFWESGPLAYAGVAFSADQFIGGVLTLKAINNGLFESGKEYRVVKGLIVDVAGDGGALIYDLTNILVNTGNSANALYKLNNASKITGKELNEMIGIVVDSIDTERTINNNNK